MDVKDRIVVVTGAAGGIGKALAERFAKAGAANICHLYARQQVWQNWNAQISKACD